MIVHLLPTDYDRVGQCHMCGRIIWIDYDAGGAWRGMQACCAECRHAMKQAQRKRYDRSEAGQEARKRQRHVRRMRKLGNGAIVERFTPMEIFARDNWICQICKRKVLKKPHPHPLSATLDHIVPLSQGGSHTKANVQLAHFLCNSRKREHGCDQLRLM